MRNTRDFLILAWKRLLSVITSWRFVLLSIALPLGLRTIPELLAGPWPLGFDTVLAYAPFVKDVETQGLGAAFSSVYHTGPLLYALLGIAAVSTGAPPFAITKAAAPLLYGFLGLSLYYFARRGLHWDQGKSLFLVILTTLYFLPLRFSWDMYKNLLGYAFFLMALAHFRRLRESRDTVLLVAFAGLSILSSGFTTVLLVAVAGAVFIFELAKERRWNLQAVILLGTAGLMTLFYMGLLLPAPMAPSPLAPPLAGSLFEHVPYNYVGSAEDVFVYPTLGDIYVTVLLLSGIVLGPLMPFVVLGFVRERRMAAWTATLTIGAFSILAWPFAAIPFWSRWMFMLAFPALVFATHGVLKVDRRIRVAFLSVVVVFAATFVALPPHAAFPYYTDSRTIGYLQTSMMQNTVPVGDSPDIVAAIEWLNGMHFNDSVLVAHASFIGWVRLYLENMRAFGFSDPSEVNGGNFSAYKSVFLVYWAVGQGWFKSSLLPARMVEIHRSANIAVYELSGPS